MKVKTSLGFEDTTLLKLSKIAEAERRSVSQIVDITMTELTPSQIVKLMPRKRPATRRHE